MFYFQYTIYYLLCSSVFRNSYFPGIDNIYLYKYYRFIGRTGRYIRYRIYVYYYYYVHNCVRLKLVYPLHTVKF